MRACAQASLTVKLGDFGLSRLHKAPDHTLLFTAVTLDSSIDAEMIDSSQIKVGMDQTSLVGSVRYMAPEMVADSKRASYTTGVDIFSCGMVAYFVWERRRPMLDGSHINTMQDYLKATMDGKRPTFNKTPKAARGIIEQCWASDPSDRPSAAQMHELWEAVVVPRGKGGGLFTGRGGSKSPKSADGSKRPKSIRSAGSRTA